MHLLGDRQLLLKDLFVERMAQENRSERAGTGFFAEMLEEQPLQELGEPVSAHLAASAVQQQKVIVEIGFQVANMTLEHRLECFGEYIH